MKPKETKFRGKKYPSLSEAARQAGISRQRVWQLLRVSEGRCFICGRPRCRETYDMCSDHRASYNEYQREHRVR